MEAPILKQFQTAKRVNTVIRDMRRLLRKEPLVHNGMLHQANFTLA